MVDPRLLFDWIDDAMPPVFIFLNILGGVPAYRLHRCYRHAMTDDLDIQIRPASAEDVNAIMSILINVACQVPTDLSTPERAQAIRRQICDCYLSECSLVAVDKNGAVIGFQLARRIDYVGELYIHLAYAAVTPPAAGNKVFKRLIEEEKKFDLPLVTEVRANNKSEMGARLLRYQFRRYTDEDTAAGRQFHTDTNHTYLWDPPQPAT
jgi:hypothetical protein